MQEFSRKIKQLQKSLAADAKRRKALEKDIEKSVAQRDKVGKQISELEEEQENLLDAQKKLWQRDNEAKLGAEKMDFRLQGLRKELASG